MEQLTQAGAERVYREKKSGATIDRKQLKHVIEALEEGDLFW